MSDLILRWVDGDYTFARVRLPDGEEREGCVPNTPDFRALSPDQQSETLREAAFRRYGPVAMAIGALPRPQILTLADLQGEVNDGEQASEGVPGQRRKNRGQAGDLEGSGVSDPGGGGAQSQPSRQKGESRAKARKGVK